MSIPGVFARGNARRSAEVVAAHGVELRKSCLTERSDLSGQLLEPRIVTQTVEIRFHIQTDKIRTSASSAVLEEGHRRVSLVDLCVTARSRFEQTALTVRLTAPAKERLKTGTLKG